MKKKGVNKSEKIPIDVCTSVRCLFNRSVYIIRVYKAVFFHTVLNMFGLFSVHVACTSTFTLFRAVQLAR